MSSEQRGPSAEQLAALQQQIAAEAQKRGLTPQQYQEQQRQALEQEAAKAGLPLNEYINRIKQQAWEQHVRQQQMAQQQQANGHSHDGPMQQQSQQVPIQPGAPNPKAVALAKWLRSQDLKPRTCLLNGERKEMYKGEFPGVYWLDRLVKSNVHYERLARTLTKRLQPRTLHYHLRPQLP